MTGGSDCKLSHSCRIQSGLLDLPANLDATQKRPRDVAVRRQTQGNSCRRRVFHICGAAHSVGPIVGDKGDDSKGSCRCGATQFTVAKQAATVTRCTCSFCSKRGALSAYQDQEEIRADHGARSRLNLPVGQLSDRTSPLRDLRLRHMVSLIPVGPRGKASRAWKIQGPGECMAAGRLRPCRAAVEVLDGKTLW